MKYDEGLRFELLARLCLNCTGADLRSICTEAGMFAIRNGHDYVSEKDYEYFQPGGLDPDDLSRAKFLSDQQGGAKHEYADDCQGAERFERTRPQGNYCWPDSPGCGGHRFCEECVVRVL